MLGVGLKMGYNGITITPNLWPFFNIIQREIADWPEDFRVTMETAPQAANVGEKFSFAN